MPQQYDPWSGMKAATNALFGVAQMAQRDRALASEEDRNRILDEKWEGEKVLLPLKYQQAKMEVAAQLLPGVTRQNYEKLYKWSREPIDKKTGHGAIPDELLPDPQQVAAMTDEQFNGLKQRMFMTAKQLSEMAVADYKTNLDKMLLDARAQKDTAHLKAVSEAQAASDARTMGQITARAGLEDKQQQNALALLEARHKAEMAELNKRGEINLAGVGGRGSRDPRMMDVMNQVQELMKERRRLAYPEFGLPPNQNAIADIDRQLAQYAERYRQLGGDPRDLLQDIGAGAPQPAAGPQGVGPTKIRTYVPGKGFVEQAPTAAGVP